MTLHDVLPLVASGFLFLALIFLLIALVALIDVGRRR